MIDPYLVIDIVRSWGIGSFLLCIVVYAIHDKFVLGATHRNTLAERDNEIQFWQRKNADLRKAVDILEMSVPRPPRPRLQVAPKPVVPPTLCTKEEQRLYLRQHMTVQGVSIPGRSPVEWSTDAGVAALWGRLALPHGSLRALSLPSHPDDPGGDRYTWIDVTTFGDPKPRYVITGPASRADSRLSNPMTR